MLANRRSQCLSKTENAYTNPPRLDDDGTVAPIDGARNVRLGADAREQGSLSMTCWAANAQNADSKPLTAPSQP